MSQKKQPDFLPTKVVCFDIWGTLFMQNKLFNTKRIELFFRTLNQYKLLEFTEVATAFRTMKEDTERHSELSGIHMGWKARLNYMCSLLAVPVPDDNDIHKLRKAYQELTLLYPPHLMSPQIPEFLDDIKESGRLVALMSNVGLVESQTVEKILKKYRINIHKEYQIFSDKTKLAKPNRLIFEYLLDTTSSKPEETIHIGDSITADYIGAQNCGIRAIHTPLSEEGIANIRRTLGLNTRRK